MLNTNKATYTIDDSYNNAIRHLQSHIFFKGHLEMPVFFDYYQPLPPLWIEDKIIIEEEPKEEMDIEELVDRLRKLGGL